MNTFGLCVFIFESELMYEGWSVYITKWLSFPVDSHQLNNEKWLLLGILSNWMVCNKSINFLLKFKMFNISSICFIYNRIHVTTICIWILYIIWEIAIGLNFDSNLKVKINFWISIKICEINQMIKCRNKWVFFNIR